MDDDLMVDASECMSDAQCGTDRFCDHGVCRDVDPAELAARKWQNVMLMAAEAHLAGLKLQHDASLQRHKQNAALATARRLGRARRTWFEQPMDDPVELTDQAESADVFFGQPGGELPFDPVAVAADVQLARQRARMTRRLEAQMNKDKTKAKIEADIRAAQMEADSIRKAASMFDANIIMSRRRRTPRH
jgi:hypothetical protein